MSVWKKIGRVFKRKGGAPSEQVGSEHDVRPEITQEIVIAPEPEPPPRDPLQDALVAFDEALSDHGPTRVTGLIRELMSQAAGDVRVLRRAGALLRELQDDALAETFELAAATSLGGPLVDLGQAFLSMNDPEIALAFANAAMVRTRSRRPRTEPQDHLGPQDQQATLSAGRLIGAAALSQMGRHDEVIARLEPTLHEGGLNHQVRFAIAALAQRDFVRFAQLKDLGPATHWLASAKMRLSAFAESNNRGFIHQEMLFNLYGAALLGALDSGSPLHPQQIEQWMGDAATLLRTVFPDGIRPAWISPRGEVFARWLSAHLRESPLPLSAKLPQQPVIVIVADDEDLELLLQCPEYTKEPLSIFQIIKDPTQFGTPIADIIGAFAADITLPLATLEAEKAIDREPPRILSQRLMREADQTELDLRGFTRWAHDRATYLSLATPLHAHERLLLDIVRDF